MALGQILVPDGFPNAEILSVCTSWFVKGISPFLSLPDVFAFARAHTLVRMAMVGVMLSRAKLAWRFRVELQYQYARRVEERCTGMPGTDRALWQVILRRFVMFCCGREPVDACRLRFIEELEKMRYLVHIPLQRLPRREFGYTKRRRFDSPPWQQCDKTDQGKFYLVRRSGCLARAFAELGV
jgi:hypothetical protein